MLHSGCTSNSASTQPVSWLVASAVAPGVGRLVNVVLLVESLAAVADRFGSVMEYVLPECVVSMCTGLGPFHAPVPVPSRTCS